MDHFPDRTATGMSDAATHVGRQESGFKKPANDTPTILRLDESKAESTLLGFEKFNSEPSPEEEAETVSDEVLRWRDTVMKRDLHPGVLCRWYLQKRNGDYLGTEEPTEPVTLSTQHDPRFSLPFENFEFGPYELTICVTVRGESLEALPTFVIQHLLISNDDEFCTISDKTHITELDQQEVDGLPRSPFTLLRLHRKVFLAEDMVGVRLGFFIPNNEYEDIPIMDIHYVEIEVSKARPIAEQGKWTRTESGDYAVTVYATDCLIHIELWDLREKRGHVSEMTPLTPPHYITTPFARTTLPVSKVISTYSVVPELALVSSISHFGTQVVLGNKERSDDGIPFTVLKCIPTAPMDSDLSRPWSLERTPTILDDSFFPMFRFHLVDTSGENDERFYTCDGSNINVYSIQGEWSHIYSLSMLPAVIPDHDSDLLMAMKGRYIPWMSTIGAISIWDLVTGKLVSHVFTSHSSGAVISNFSEDGSSMLVSVNGAIELYDTLSGIKLGVYRDGLGLEGYYQVQFAQDYFVANTAESSSKDAIKCDSRNIVRARDMTAVNSFHLMEDYAAISPGIFAYDSGSAVNFIRKDRLFFSDSTQSELCGPETVCETEHLVRMTSTIGEVYSVNSSDASQFLLEFSTLNLRSRHITVLGVKLLDKSGGVAKRMMIPLGSYSTDHHATFVSATSQLVLLTGSFLHVWKLSASNPEICKLLFIWRLQERPPGMLVADLVDQKYLSADFCRNCGKVMLGLSPVVWYRTSPHFFQAGKMERGEVVTIPISPQDTLATSEEFRIENGFLGLINMFTDGTDGCRKVIIDYLRENVRSTPTRPFSSLTTICRAWTTENRVYVEKILRGLLPDDRITWVPDIRLNKDVDPLAIVLKIAKTHFPAIRVARVIMDYCVIHANKARNLAFLAPFFGSLYDIMSLSPDDALLRLGRITFIPAMHRSYILDNHMLIRPPQFRLRFWTPDSRTLIETKDPIMQLHISGDKPDPSNDGFAYPIFMASFDALWSYNDSKPLEMSDDAKAETAIATATTWWKTLFYLLRLKSRLRAHTFVECYDFNLEFFDNPAVAALVGYKWSTMGIWYFSVRFTLQCCFYVMVVIAAIMQVYHSKPSDLIGLFIAIIVLSVMFLWLELLQAVRSVSRYTRSSYNFLDVVAYGLPMAASIDQIVVILQGNIQGNSRSLSFSVLAVFLHMLFELRINKSVCKYVTIIQQAVIEIRVFFFILAGGILAFTIAILHLLRSCPYEGCDSPTTELPRSFVGALSATYFFMGGVWDPVSADFTTEQWAFHLMMAIFFFFTVILMLNVLIALINKAFEKGDDDWRLVWIESRLRFIESAENMSYHIPGFRQTHNWFPKEIYFSATPEQIKAYRTKYHEKDERENKAHGMPVEWLKAPDVAHGYADDGTDDEESKDTVKKFKENGNVEKEEEKEGKGKFETTEEDIDALNVAEAEAEAKDGDEEEQPREAVDVSLQVRSLESQVRELQKQLVEQLEAQQEQAQRQETLIAEQLAAQQQQAQRQYEDIKNLLLLLRPL
ncbi:hypothetical protein BGZ99_001233 [Dissophora globulifera]|uniref:Ion transport domain-containing protein n=1 Tax=Dissophora globulifera TaxID=979702 RepID=A0A9P6V0L6_9FUNG|nr:hypothetical protein BGZ99_001233 [Dissophora globulifera]